MNPIQKELERLRKKGKGMLHAADVVNAAADETSVLHASFDWDDATAAWEHRLEQARSLIRVFVKVIGPSETETQVYVSLSSDRIKGGGYRQIDEVMGSALTRQTLLSDALKELGRVQVRYQHLEELASVWDVVSKIPQAAD